MQRSEKYYHFFPESFEVAKVLQEGGGLSTRIDSNKK